MVKKMLNSNSNSLPQHFWRLACGGSSGGQITRELPLHMRVRNTVTAKAGSFHSTFMNPRKKENSKLCV